MSDGASFVSSAHALEYLLGHRRLTRRMIEAFPEEHLFSYSLAGLRPFGEMVGELLNLGAPMVEGAATGSWAEFGSVTQPTTKAELLARWDEDTRRIEQVWPTISEERFAQEDVAFGFFRDKVWSLLQYAVDNEIHHRGQGYVYLRSLGTEPPAFYER